MDVSLATAEKLDTPTQVPSTDGPLEIDENLRAGRVSTSGKTEYDFRRHSGTISLTSTNKSGHLLKVINLDTTLAQANFTKDYFQYYMFTNVYLVLKCIAPFSTASGSIQVAYNSDPENVFSTNEGTAIQQAMNLLESKQVSSKGEVTVSIDVNQFASPVYGKLRYVKKAANSNPRSESFGQLAVIVRGAAFEGGSTAWSLTVGGTIRVMNKTFNSTTTTYRTEIVIPPPNLSSVVLTYPPLGKNGLSGTLNFPAPTTIASAGTFIMQQPFDILVTAQDNSADDEFNTQNFNTSIHSCNYVADGKTVTLFFDIFKLDPTVVNLDTSTFISHYDGPAHGIGLYESIQIYDTVGRTIDNLPKGTVSQQLPFFQSIVDSLIVPNWQKIDIFKSYIRAKRPTENL